MASQVDTDEISLENVRLLLDKGADPNHPDEDGDTALHVRVCDTAAACLTSGLTRCILTNPERPRHPSRLRGPASSSVAA